MGNDHAATPPSSYIVETTAQRLLFCPSKSLICDYFSALLNCVISQLIRMRFANAFDIVCIGLGCLMDVLYEVVWISSEYRSALARESNQHKINAALFVNSFGKDISANGTCSKKGKEVTVLLF